MNQVTGENDLAEMLARGSAALFIFVEWSAYARRGREVFKQAAAKLGAKSPNDPVSWWIADISSIDVAVGPALHQWLTLQEQSGTVRLFPGVAMGNGSVLWIEKGEAVGFELNAQRAGLEALVHCTEEMLADS